RGEPSGVAPRGAGELRRPPVLRRLRSSSCSTWSHVLNCLLCCRCLMEGDLTGALEAGGCSTRRRGASTPKVGRPGSGSYATGTVSDCASPNRVDELDKSAEGSLSRIGQGAQDRIGRFFQSPARRGIREPLQSARLKRRGPTPLHCGFS